MYIRISPQELGVKKEYPISIDTNRTKQ